MFVRGGVRIITGRCGGRGTARNGCGGIKATRGGGAKSDGGCGDGGNGRVIGNGSGGDRIGDGVSRGSCRLY